MYAVFKDRDVEINYIAVLEWSVIGDAVADNFVD
jgi:hypothetical protein